MKKLIKLKDLTKEQWDNCNSDICSTIRCENCIFYKVYCGTTLEKKSWINNKDLYSDKFLNQEIEIEIPDILDKEEKEYLSAVIKPFRKKFVNIKKEVRTFGLTKVDERLYYYLTIRIESKTHVLSDEYIDLPYFKEDMYKGMEVDKCYTLEELGL